MKRRAFLTSAALCGAGVSASAIKTLLGETAPRRPIAEGGQLTPPANGLLNVAFAVSSGTTWIDWVGPQAVFETWHFDPVGMKHGPRFKLFTVSERLELVNSLMPDYTYESAPPANVVVVPNQRGSPALLEWLRKVSKTSDVLMSVCTGARQLAKAGLLDGKTATTHHEAIEDFSKEFPNVKWVGGVRFVEGATISTAGGLTSGIDLALRVVERYFGRTEAQKVADHIEYRCPEWTS